MLDFLVFIPYNVSMKWDKDTQSYFLGLFATDGGFYETTRIRGRISIELAIKDKDILEKLQGVIPVKSTITTRTRDTNYMKDYTSARLDIHDRGFRDWLKLNYDPGKKSNNVSPPKTSFVRKSFYRGVIDGDGSLGFTARGFPFLSLCTNSENIARDYINLIFEVTGRWKTTSRNKRDRVYNIAIYQEDAQIFAEYLYGDSEIHLDREYNAYLRISKWRRPRGMRRIISRRWTKEEELFVQNNSIKESCVKLGRTERSVKMKRWRLSKGARGRLTSH